MDLKSIVDVRIEHLLDNFVSWHEGLHSNLLNREVLDL